MGIQNAAFPLSFLLLGGVSSSTSRTVRAGKASQGKEGQSQTAITCREHACALLPSVSPVPPTRSRAAAADSVGHEALWSLRRAGTAGGTFQLHPQQQQQSGDMALELSVGTGVRSAAHEGQPGTTCAAVVLPTRKMMGPHGLAEFLTGGSSHAGCGGFCLSWIKELFRDLGQTSKTG